MVRSTAALALCLLLALAAAQDWQEEYEQRDNAEELSLSRRSAEPQNQQQQRPLDRLDVQSPVVRPERPADYEPYRPPNRPESRPAILPPVPPPVRPVRPPVSPPRPNPQRAPPGYSRVGSFGFFKVFLNARSWTDALMTCIQDDALLAVPNSEREAVAVGEFYGRFKSKVQNAWDKNLFFIGANDLSQTGTFTTLRGTQFNKGQWYRWAKGEPTKINNSEHCVLSDDKGFYWDGNCETKMGFVCEFVENSPPPPRFDNLQKPSVSQQKPNTKN